MLKEIEEVLNNWDWVTQGLTPTTLYLGRDVFYEVMREASFKMWYRDEWTNESFYNNWKILSVEQDNYIGFGV